MTYPTVMLLRRLFLLSAATWFVWRIVSLGLSAHYMESVQASPDATAKALAWNPRHPEALYREGLALREQDTDTAASLFARAYAENPADVRSLVALAEIARARGDQARSQDLLEAALRLSPADPWLEQRAARYRLADGDLDAALRHWSAALEMDPALQGALFPILLQLAEDSRTRHTLEPFALAPPSWWPSFFAHVATKAQNTDTIRVLYALRKESRRTPVSDMERKAYVEHMAATGHGPEAYAHWASGLDREQRRQMALLYNGSFEVDPLNWGFGWRISSIPQALVDRGTTFGVDGSQALRLIFRDHEGPFSGVAQSLFLDPGRYRLSGRVATDSLDSAGGIQWRVRCTLPEQHDLGRSERFLGANPWRDFALDFAVPESCVFQELALVTAGDRPFEQRLTGGAWFDRLAIRRQPEQATGADATERARAGDG